jgi:1-acyl-sn-glycerol-3-phosphate acyltransferase
MTGETLAAASGASATSGSAPPWYLGAAGFGRAALRLTLLAILMTATNVLAKVCLPFTSAPDHFAPRVFSCLARLLIRLLGVDLHFEGTPPQGLSVVVANHRSYVDIPLVMSVVPSVFLAKSEIGGWPAFGTAARLARTVFVDREDAESRKRALTALGAALDEGETITVFPEGTTTTGPGCLPFRLGAFRLAAARNLPVVPIAIAYGDRRDAWVDDTSFVAHFLERFRAPRMAVSFTIGPAFRDADASSLKDQTERWIRDRLADRDGCR